MCCELYTMHDIMSVFEAVLAGSSALRHQCHVTVAPIKRSHIVATHTHTHCALRVPTNKPNKQTKKKAEQNCKLWFVRFYIVVPRNRTTARISSQSHCCRFGVTTIDNVNLPMMTLVFLFLQLPHLTAFLCANSLAQKPQFTRSA